MLNINKDPNHLLSDVRVFALDMDGTIYLGEKWIDGAKDFLSRVKESGRDYVFLTNNSSKNALVYVEKLERMGLSVPSEHIITSGQATIWYLKQHFPGKSVFLCGNSLLQREFAEAGILLTDHHPDIAVLGFDTELTYAKLCLMCDFVRSGIPYLATHPDFNCPTETGFIPDAGAMMALIHASAGRYPDHVIGKPNREIVDYTMERLHRIGHGSLHRHQVAMVGDRIYTDIKAGMNGGLRSILVLSGESDLQTLADSDAKPDLVFDSVAFISEFLNQ